MNRRSDLENHLSRIDSKSYGAYKSLKGEYDFGDYYLCFDHVQGDPFASPSRLAIELEPEQAGFPDWTYSSSARRVALEDFLGRRFRSALERAGKLCQGSGKSGFASIAVGGQQVLRRTAVTVEAGKIELRFALGLPAQGRRVLGQQAARALLSRLPELVEKTLVFSNTDRKELERHLWSVEDQQHLRAQLESLGLVSFVANGSILPRRSGVDDRPLSSGAVEFHSPQSMLVELETPHRGKVQGMGLAEGVSLVVGGGYHGKSTLLDAVAMGVYDHIPGDGRELVVTVPDTMKIRAEDRRSVQGVNISAFLSNLPRGKSTEFFSTEDASGSTSQAATIVESLEAGARCLLIDEDTSATNFMIRDARMQRLVQSEREPIIPFIDRVKSLKEDHGVSTILVMGGSGDYLEVADRVILLDEYQVLDVTEKSREVCEQLPTQRRPESRPMEPLKVPRVPKLKSLSAEGKRGDRVEARTRTSLTYGNREIQLGALEQLVDRGQTHAIGWMIRDLARNYRKLGIGPGVRRMFEETDHLDEVTPVRLGDLSWPRPLEVAAALNRLRGLTLEDSGGEPPSS